MSNTKIIQGDVVFRKINDLPEDLIELKGLVLQESEVTGNHHQFTKDSNVRIFARKESVAANSNINTITPDEGKFVVIGNNAVLFHGKEGELNPDPVKRGVADHMPITIPPGTYKIGIVREWDYENQVSSRVVD